MRPVSLAAILPLLGGGGCDGDCKGESTPAHYEAALEVSPEELEAALDADGELTDEACEALCRAHHPYEAAIAYVEDCGLDYDTSTTTPDTGAPVAAGVYCGWTEIECEGRARTAVRSRPGGVGPDRVAAWLAPAAQAEATSVEPSTPSPSS